MKTGTVQGSSATSASFHRTENGSEVTGAHTEVTNYEGDKSTDNGVVTAEHLHVSKEPDLVEMLISFCAM